MMVIIVRMIVSRAVLKQLGLCILSISPASVPQCLSLALKPDKAVNISNCAGGTGP